jgi:serine protease Do
MPGSSHLRPQRKNHYPLQKLTSSGKFLPANLLCYQSLIPRQCYCKFHFPILQLLQIDHSPRALGDDFGLPHNMTSQIRKLEMNNSKLPAPKMITRLALIAALSASTMALGIVSPALQIKSASAEPVKLEAPQVPGFADVVEAVSPAVVSVRVEAGVELASQRRQRRDFRFDRRFFEDEGRDPFFRDHRRNRQEGQRRSQRPHNKKKHRRFGMSQGSGFFVSEDGYIVTNNHVIHNSSKITVVMHDGTELEATLVGSDKRTDLAVLKVKFDKKFTYVEFDDKNPRIGEWVVAVGNPFGLGGTVTAGIVSANGRQISASRYDDFIQIDAAVNKGNSGGPTFNLSGRVVGVNTAIFSPSGGNVGIAFAIPASTASAIVEDLIDDGKVMRGWLGVGIQSVNKDIAESIGLEEAKGAIVTTTADDSPAQSVGIKPGDVIIAVNGKKIKGSRALAREIGKIAPASDTKITLWSDGESKEVTLKLGTLNENANNQHSGQSKVMKGAQRLGLELRPSRDGNGVEVVDVIPGSRAAKRGIRTGDNILSINGEQVSNPEQVISILKQVKKLDRKAVLLQIERGGDSQFIAIPLRRG